MILFDYECEACEIVFEKAVETAEDKVPCVKCGGETSRLPGFRKSSFKPFWHPNLDINPVYIESEKQLKREAAKRGLTAPLFE